MPMRGGGERTQVLPDDPETLRALLLAAWSERDAAAAARDALAAECDSVAAERDGVVSERDELAVQYERLRHFLLKLRRMQFGPRSERLPEDQLQLAFEEVEASLAGNEAEAEKRSPELRRRRAARRRAGRGRLPAHLPLIEQVLLPESTACPRAPPARAAEAGWWRSAATPPSGST